MNFGALLCSALNKNRKAFSFFYRITEIILSLFIVCILLCSYRKLSTVSHRKSLRESQS